MQLRNGGIRTANGACVIRRRRRHRPPKPNTISVKLNSILFTLSSFFCSFADRLKETIFMAIEILRIDWFWLFEGIPKWKI